MGGRQGVGMRIKLTSAENTSAWQVGNVVQCLVGRQRVGMRIKLTSAVKTLEKGGIR